MKIVIIGGSGMLGHKLLQILSEKFDVWTTIRDRIQNYNKFNLFSAARTFENVDIQNISSVEAVIREVKPQIIINAVGLIKQLPAAKDVVKVLLINSVFPNQLAELAAENNARLITFSTDCVFNGKKGNYTENDLPDAIDLYGKSKHLGEVSAENCLTIRTSIIGRELHSANSLVEWFLSNRGKKVKGFLNAIYTGLPTVVMAHLIANLIENHAALSGLYHISSDPINKFDLLRLINEIYDANIEIEPFEEFKIDRSLDSTKFREATGFVPLKWEQMIELMANDNALYVTDRNINKTNIL